jgi:hypothetical protein
MKLHSLNHETIADFLANQQDQHVLLIDIVQHAEITDAHFPLREGIRSQRLDRPSDRRGRLRESGRDAILDDSLIVNRKPAQLSLRLVGDHDLEWHTGPSNP